MAIDNDVITQNLEIINSELEILDTQRAKKITLRDNYETIHKTDHRVPNLTGGFDIVKKMPNKLNLSNANLLIASQAIYDDSNTKFATRND